MLRIPLKNTIFGNVTVIMTQITGRWDLWTFCRFLGRLSAVERCVVGTPRCVGWHSAIVIPTVRKIPLENVTR